MQAELWALVSERTREGNIQDVVCGPLCVRRAASVMCLWLPWLRRTLTSSHCAWLCLCVCVSLQRVRAAVAAAAEDGGAGERKQDVPLEEDPTYK